MEGLVEEGSEVMKEGLKDAVLDAALIGTAQRVEHYEIAVLAFAQTLGESDHVALLEGTLSEKKETDKKLTELAKQINKQAVSGDRIQPAPGEASGRKRTKRIA
jgi:ferritin-like metal-binding protein YciE